MLSLKRHDAVPGRLDWVLLLSVLALCVLGTFMVYSSSYFYAMKRFDDPAYFLKRRVIWLAWGLIWLFGAARIHYRVWIRAAGPMLLVSLVLLGLVMTGLGTEVGGSRRWLRLGGLSFQPSELAKFSLVLFLAASLERKGEAVRSFMRGVLPYLLVGAVVTGLVMAEPDFGMGMTIMGLLLLMLFVAGMRVRYVLFSVAAAVPLVVLMVVKYPYRLRRITAFLNPWDSYDTGGFQLVQSLLSFISGGATGVGLGSGRQKLFFLPEAHTDFLLSVVGEELGFVGVAIILTLFVILLVRGAAISLRAPDPFGSFLAIGVTLLIAFQACLNAGVSVGLLPTKGMPLPFLSHGGSSLWFHLTAVGILLSIRKRLNETAADRVRGHGRASVPSPGHRGALPGKTSWERARVFVRP